MHVGQRHSSVMHKMREKIQLILRAVSVQLIYTAVNLELVFRALRTLWVIKAVRHELVLELWSSKITEN